MFQDIIELLLQKKANLREELEREFAERSAKLDEMLSVAGYVEPVEETLEEAEEIADNSEVSNEAVYPYQP